MGIAIEFGDAQRQNVIRDYHYMSRLTTNSVATKALLIGTVASIALFSASPAMAQTSGTNAVDEEPAKEIIVIGTRRTDRTIADSASPVDVISAADLSTQPSSNLLDSLKNVVPSFFAAQNTISDASTFVRAPSLRGLPADQILVLLNGKRFNRSALVQTFSGGDTALSYGSNGSDISSIPAIAVKNLQILREGATAQYGANAIAGVLNYGFRDDVGFELQARYGQYYDRGDGKSKQLAANFGYKLGDAGFVNVSGEYSDDGQTIRNATRPIALQFAAAFPALASQLPGAAAGEPVQVFGSSPSTSYKLVLNSGYDVGSDSKVYFTVVVARSSANQSFNYRSPIAAITPFVVDNGSGTPATSSPGRNSAFAHPAYLTRCPTGNPTCPAGGFVLDTNVFNFSTLYPAGFTPRFIGVNKEAFGTLGFKGKADSGFTYDLSATLARTSLALSGTNSLNQSFGPQTQTSFNFGSTIQREFTANLDLTYPVEVGFASPITLSGGAEYHRETYEATQGDTQSFAAGPFAVQDLYRQTTPGVFAFDSTVRFSPAASGYGGNSPSSVGKFRQTNYAIYVGAETDITKALTVGLAGRFESYNTFGSTFVGKANALYRVSDAFSIRGTFGTGFQAPSPGQSNTEVLTTNFVAGNQVQTGTFQVNNPISVALGSRPLVPAKSTNFGAGFVVKPASNITLTVDGYIINVRNRIFISQPFTVTQARLNANPALAAVGLGGDVNFFTNSPNTSTKGVDVIGTYRTELGAGKLNLTLAYNFNQNKVTRADPAVISPVQVSDIENFAPKHRVVLSGAWSLGDLLINARGNYYSSWSVQNDYPGQVFGAKATADLDVSYTIAENYTITLGANNIFNTKPDRIAPTTANPIFAVTGSTADGQIYPRSGGPFGINGGFWYARLRIKY